MRVHLLAGLLMAGGLSACSPTQSEPPAPVNPGVSAAGAGPAEPRQPATRKAEDMKRPFLVGEASLPDGFPPPATVGEIVVKDYPACRAAVVRSGAGENRMFRTLFDHIKRNNIAMTAPVEMGYAGDPAASPMVSMAFLYRNPAQGRLGPDQDVTVADLPPIKVVSVAFRGSYTAANYARAAAKLHQWLQGHAGEYQASGAVRVLGYNSPFVPWFMKYAEVQIPITPAKAP